MFYLQTFENGVFGKIRCLEVSHIPCFIAHDVIKSLALDLNTNDVEDYIQYIQKDDKIWIDYECLRDSCESNPRKELYGLNKNGEYLINERGLYDLISIADSLIGNGYRWWIISKVLPAIRKDIKYLIPNWMMYEDVIKNRYALYHSITTSDIAEDFGIAEHQLIYLLEIDGIFEKCQDGHLYLAKCFDEKDFIAYKTYSVSNEEKMEIIHWTCFGCLYIAGILGEFGKKPLVEIMYS